MNVIEMRMLGFIILCVDETAKSLGRWIFISQVTAGACDKHTLCVHRRGTVDAGVRVSL